MTILSFIITMLLLHYVGFLFLQKKVGDVVIKDFVFGTVVTTIATTVVFASFNSVLNNFFGG